MATSPGTCTQHMVTGWTPVPETHMTRMRCSRCSKVSRKLEIIFLGTIFLCLTVLLYEVLSTDHVTVMGWFGVKVNIGLNRPRQRLISSINSKEIKHGAHLAPGDPSPDPEAGLFVDQPNVDDLHEPEQNNEEITIAIGCAITSRTLKSLSVHTLGQVSPFLRTFLPSFCRTVKNDIHQYKFFLAYDSSDPFFSDYVFKQAFRKEFDKIIKFLCPSHLDTKLRFVRCPYSGRPAWSQNDAMFTAYLDNTDYFYRINDDTSLSSAGWSKALRLALDHLQPPNVGVVGPAHAGGNEMILAYDFVHKTHLDIFGFYYPRTFPDWWADDWISGVYGRARTNKMESVKAIHTGEKGTRYNHSWTAPEVLTNRILQDRSKLDRYLSWRSPDTPTMSFPKGKKVISVSLYGDGPKYTYGAIRNAVLTPFIFPGWALRVYVEKTRDDGSTLYPRVPDLIVRKLRSLKAEIAYVDTGTVKVPPMMWRFLVADDQTVEAFIVRDTDSRLIGRDAEIVSEWLETDHPFHCVRDHPSHRSAPIFGGLLGGRSRPLREIIRERWQNLMRTYENDYGMDIMFLSNTIWPRVKYYALCHDSVSCRWWGPNAWPFPTPRQNYEHIGQVFNCYGEARGIDIDLLKLYPEPWECTLRGGESRQSWLQKQKANARMTKTQSSQKRLTHAQQEVEKTRRHHEEAKIPSLTGRVVMWSMDYETAYIKDLKTLLGPRGVIFVDKSLAENCMTAGTCPHNLTVITPANGMNADRQLADRFYDRYKDDPEVRKVTHFVCFRPVSMCELYARFKKSVIIVATRRYEEGRLTPDRWRELNDNLTQLQSSSRNIVGATNHYDVEYMRYFTGFDPEYLPSYCAYADHVPNNHSRPEFLVAPISNVDFRLWFTEALQRTVTKLKVKIKVAYVGDLYPQDHDLADLAAHPGIIHIPEQVSDMRVCEQYRLAVPLYFPSLELLAKWNKQYKLLRNRTFSSERLKKHGISIAGSPIRAVALGRFDPNDDGSAMSLRYWLRFADFLHLPHVGHFDSLEDLVDLLVNSDPRVTSGQMRRFSRRFKAEMTSKWINLINRTLL